jgi:hypothetical protein
MIEAYQKARDFAAVEMRQFFYAAAVDVPKNGTSTAANVCVSCGSVRQLK